MTRLPATEIVAAELADDGGAFLRQLSPPGYVMDLRPEPTAAPAPTPPDGAPIPAVLAVSRARDPELGEVATLLRKAGVPCVRIDADRLPAAGLLIDPARRMTRLAGRWLAPTVTWFRHFSAKAIDEPAGAAHALFAQESWEAAAHGLAAISGVSIGAARPGLLMQLRVAAQHGIEVPRTFVTTDPAQVAGQFTGETVVVKAAGGHFVEAAPGRLTGVFPVVVRRDSLAAGPGPPVIVQEYVPHQAELRVYYVHGRLYGFGVGKEVPADPWLNPHRLTVGGQPLGHAVAEAARTLAAAFGFRCAAFDFLICDGEPVFLEADPRGDWRWIEQRTGTSPVSEAVAGLLCDLHRAQLPAGGNTFSLLSFLAG